MPNLSQKLGPFPIWIWGIVGAGGVWYYHHTHPSAPVIPTAPGQPMTSQNAGQRRYGRKGGRGKRMNG